MTTWVLILATYYRGVWRDLHTITEDTGGHHEGLSYTREPPDRPRGSIWGQNSPARAKEGGMVPGPLTD